MQKYRKEFIGREFEMIFRELVWTKPMLRKDVEDLGVPKDVLEDSNTV